MGSWPSNRSISSSLRTSWIKSTHTSKWKLAWVAKVETTIASASARSGLAVSTATFRETRRIIRRTSSSFLKWCQAIRIMWWRSESKNLHMKGTRITWINKRRANWYIMNSHHMKRTKKAKRREWIVNRIINRLIHMAPTRLMIWEKMGRSRIQSYWEEKIRTDVKTCTTVTNLRCRASLNSQIAMQLWMAKSNKRKIFIWPTTKVSCLELIQCYRQKIAV